MYAMDTRIRYSEVDKEQNITLQALLDLFQDCCSFQSEELGIGLEYLTETGSAWILSSWQIIVNRYPKFGENVQVQTWPYDFKGFYGYRNFRMVDEDQEVLAYANSVWVFLDAQTGRPQKVSDELIERYAFEDPIDHTWASRKIKLPGEMEKQAVIPVQHYHIDTNHHVNNARYVQMAEEFLSEDFAVGQIRVEYRKAAVLSDQITPMVSREEGRVLISLAANDEKPYAIVEFTAR